MLATLDNRVISSFLLYLDHEIQSKGSGFSNTVTRFYPERSSINGNYLYTSPIKSLCNDLSITGANIMSGVYIGNSYISIGRSGLNGINHYNGTLYFTGTNPESFGLPISGRTSLKEISVKLTDKTDWKLLFDTKYVNNGSQSAPTTGLDSDTEVSPIVYLRYIGQENKPFGFSKLDNQVISLRAIVIADNEYQKISVMSIIKNININTIPVVLRTPFNSMGTYTGENYDFTRLSNDPSLTPIVLSAKARDIAQRGEYSDIRRSMGMVDIDIGTVARPN